MWLLEELQRQEYYLFINLLFSFMFLFILALLDQLCLFFLVKKGLFGHILITKAHWDQLWQYSERYFEDFKRFNCVGNVISQIESVILEHPLGRSGLPTQTSPTLFRPTVASPTKIIRIGMKRNVLYLAQFSSGFILKGNQVKSEVREVRAVT